MIATAPVTESLAPVALSPTPLVSVIIDNYNYGRFLQTAITSVFAQTYQHFELIIVDDGSTDQSRDVIEAYCDAYHDRIIPVFQQNKGQGGACSTGVAHAQGEIVCFLDADDYYHPHKLEKVVQAFQTHPEWVQVAHCWISVNKDGTPRGRSTSNVLSQGDMRPLLLKWGKYASGITSALSYRRHVLAAVMPAPDRCIIDSYLNASVPFYGKVGCINEPLMYYRMHGNNVQAYNSNIDYLLSERRAIAAFINQTAEAIDSPQRFDLHYDVDYRAYSIAAQGRASYREKILILWLSIQESVALGRSWRDGGIRFLFRSLCVLSPQDAPALMGLGFRRYLKHRLTKLRRRMVSLPAETAMAVSHLPWVEQAVLHPRYQAARDRHQAHLPTLRASDIGIVETIDQQGFCITSLEDLALPNTDGFLAAAQSIFVQLQEQAATAQGSLNASFQQLMNHPELFHWGLNDRLLHIAETYLGLPVAYDTFTCTLSLKQAAAGGTRLWHIDHEDRRMLKLIVYLTDVDETSGPFQYIQPHVSDRLLQAVPSQLDFLTQADLDHYLPYAPADYLTSCTGKAGTVIFVDTARAYHRGKPPIGHDRHAVFFGYLSRRPRHPFRCGRNLLSQAQLRQLSAQLPPEKQACVHWQDTLPAIAKLIPRYRYYKL